MTKMVINGVKRSKTLKEVKAVENRNKNHHIFSGISPVQN